MESRREARRIVQSLGASAAAAVLAIAVAANAQENAAAPSRSLVGAVTDYGVGIRDSLSRLAARFGVDAGELAALNGLRPSARLAVGQKLRIDARHVPPPELPEWGIVVNVPQRFLWYSQDGEIFGFPVAVGRPDWHTPLGDFRIATKERDPTWVVPASIQAEMKRLGQPVLRRVPPGPSNPLGRFWMGLSGSGCGIHATNAPSSIYGFRTHGCIRLHPDDAARVFEAAAVGMPVRVAYEPLLLLQTEDGAIWLEAHPDPYRLRQSPTADCRAIAARAGIEDSVDWALVGEVLQRRDGAPHRVTLQRP